MTRKNRIIYIDNAATTKLCSEAFDAMMPYYREEYANPSGAYDFAQKVKKDVEEAREDIGKAIGASVREIFFTSGGTESDNLAIKGAAGLGERPHIIVSVFEHHAVLNSCRQLEEEGVQVSYVNPNPKGYTDISDIARKIRKETVLISVMTVNNEIGTIQPVADIGALAHEHGILFHTDAVAACGHIPIDVKAMNIDLLSASAHKFKGPKGAGFLYVTEGVKLKPLIFGGGQERGLRSGTENVAGVIGMAAALKKMNFCMEDDLKRRRELDNYFLKKTEGADFADRVKLNGEGTCRMPGHFSVTIDGMSGEELTVRLGMKGICVSTGAACTSSGDNVSHVLKSIGLGKKAIENTIRITMNEDNTEEELDILFEYLEEFVKR